jgi:hypothetical protein
MTKHSDPLNSDSSAPTSPEITRLSGEQAEERAATEIRKAKDWLDDYTEVLRIRDGDHKWQIARALAAYAQSETSLLASRVEELKQALENALIRLLRCKSRLRELKSEGWAEEAWKWAAEAERTLAGKKAE